ncbi:MAG: TetR/AcrR family transcriptional regulator [Pseudomonadales bacterium]
MSSEPGRANTASTRRTQAERRAESRQAVLDSACRLFGQQGYAQTSLEEIAADCDLTIRPIYHYFGNKKALFAAVNEVMEARILAAHQEAGPMDNWRAFLNLCDDPDFRRIVLVDSPIVLGRERWSSSAVFAKARKALDTSRKTSATQQFRTALQSRAMLAAFTEAALMVAESEDLQLAKREAERLIVKLSALLTDPD